MDVHEELFYTDVFAQPYFCMISDGGHAFPVTSVQQADAFRGKRLIQRKPALQFRSIQFLAIDISCKGVACRGHQSTPALPS